VSKTYTAAGSYTATVTVTDNLGLSASRSFPITVSVDPTAKTLRVQSVAVSVVSSRGQAAVKITNPAGTPVSGVSVYGSWSGIITGSSGGTTDATGTVVLQSSTLKKTGTLTFTVTSVGKSGYTYSPAQNLQSSGTLQVGAAAIAR
jgi:PKD repeat protein